MSGRGCTISVTVLSSQQNNTQDVNLPVALHTPLSILRTDLQRLTNISLDNQVLILLDLSDPEGNSNVLLTGKDHLTLYECGIRNDSKLTLHALGYSAESQMASFKEILSATNDPSKKLQLNTITTAITPARANHSYNGVIFDVEVRGPYEIEMHSIHLGGMLGPIKIFVRDRPWENDNEDQPPSQWWAHHENISRQGWSCVYSRTLLPSWDKPYEIKLDKPVKFLPNSRHGIYCHSSLPDDLGIQYQSYRQSDIIAANEYITLHPGLGHTGSTPFDHHNGWYRAWRGLAGAISYTVKRKGWTLDCHTISPRPLQSSVKVMLLCHSRDIQTDSASQKSHNTSNTNRTNRTNRTNSNSTSNMNSSGKAGTTHNNNSYEDNHIIVDTSLDKNNIIYEMDDNMCTDIISSSKCNALSSTTSTSSKSLYHLPKFVLLHILEFMHWDWFKDVEYTYGNTDTLTNPTTTTTTTITSTQSLSDRSTYRGSSLLRHFLQGGGSTAAVETRNNLITPTLNFLTLLGLDAQQFRMMNDDLTFMDMDLTQDDDYEDADEDEDEDDEDYIDDEDNEEEYEEDLDELDEEDEYYAEEEEEETGLMYHLEEDDDADENNHCDDNIE